MSRTNLIVPKHRQRAVNKYCQFRQSAKRKITAKLHLYV